MSIHQTPITHTCPDTHWSLIPVARLPFCLRSSHLSILSRLPFYRFSTSCCKICQYPLWSPFFWQYQPESGQMLMLLTRLCFILLGEPSCARGCFGFIVEYNSCWINIIVAGSGFPRFLSGRKLGIRFHHDDAITSASYNTMAERNVRNFFNTPGFYIFR